jgi:hypothetical protein
MQEAGEEFVDGDGGLEFREAGGEISGEVRLLGAIRLCGGMGGAETGGGVGDVVTATAAGASAVLTTGQVIGGARVG